MLLTYYVSKATIYHKGSSVKVTTYGYLPWPPGLATAKEEPFSGEEGFEDGSDQCEEDEEEKEEENAEEQPDEDLEQTEEDRKNKEEP